MDMARYGMLIDLRSCTGCQACSAACALENQTPYWADKWRTRVLDVQMGEFPNTGRHFIPTICMHCEEAACMDICPSKATFKTDEGFVLVNYDTCLGCKACMAACPYGARYVYTREDVQKAAELYGENAQHQTIHIDKCTLCQDRIVRGLEPACVAACPTRSRRVGNLDNPADPEAQAVSSGLAKPLRPELGTQPRVYYVF